MGFVSFLPFVFARHLSQTCEHLIPFSITAFVPFDFLSVFPLNPLPALAPCLPSELFT